LIVLVLAVLAAAGYPVFAQGPPEQEGKQSSIVDPLIRQFIEQQGSATPQPTPQPDSSAFTRGLVLDSGVTAKGVPGTADSGAWGATTGDAEGGSESEAADAKEAPVRFDSSGNVQVYIHLENTNESTLQQLRELGATIEVTNSDWNIAQAWVAPSALDALAALAVVKEITPPDYGQTKTGRVNSEGDGIHRADLVRSISGISGRGVKVGVISDGVNAWRAAKASRDLPDSLEIHPGSSGRGDEGTALLEIIHDLAPNAELAFSGPDTNLEMVDSILWLANDAFDGEGVDVIVDDLGYYSEAFYEDGPLALAAADAVAGGVVFASSAGNNNNKHYTGTFSDDGNGYHDFDSSSATDISLRIGVGNSVALQWNDQFGSSGNDYDLFVCPPGLKPVKFNLQNNLCAGSNREQDGDDNPYERVSTYFLDSSTADVYIRKYSGDARELKLFVLRGSVREHGVTEGSIIGHEAVEGLLSIGAIDASDPGNDEAQFYSDRGPVEIYFPTRETRNKPDLMGIDGVLITGSGRFGRPIEGSSFRRFFGTSAAAPHVAGIAALVMEAQRKADPTMTKKEVADAVTQKLKDTAIDLGEDGFDTTFGYGRADAWSAIESLASSSDSLDLHSLTTYEDTHTVNSTGDGADSDTTDGICDDGTVDGATNCTLRAAIQQTNAGTSGAIEFNISGGGVQTISPASALPAITKPVFIDGYSQPGASAGTVLIEIDGSNAPGSSTDGLTLTGGRSLIRGLAINDFNRRGIVLQNSSRYILEGNMIGTDTTGSTDEGNGNWGVYLSRVYDALLKDNVISGNESHGVLTSIGGPLFFYGNKIGTNAAGTADLGNAWAGIEISSRQVVIRDNVISGNNTHGIYLDSNVTTQAVIENNRIGTNDAGTAALGNTSTGIYFEGDPKDNLVTGNIIGGNGSHGIWLYNAYVRDNLIADNYIGTNASDTDLGNGGSGVHISQTSLGGPDDNTIEHNTIAYNGGDGVTITGSGSLGNTVRENSIHSNDGIGIDLGDDGVTANDATDSDSGPNHLQNYPHNITYATRGDEASAGFDLYMTANRRYEVDFYSCDSSTSGEGKDWLGYTFGTLSTSELGNFNVSTLISGHWFGFSATAATHITATATDTEAGTTSEFAPCVARVDLPELVISETEVEVAEGGTATYTVRMSALPSEDVTVTLTSGNTSEATVSDETLTFTTTNGTSAQTVTVTGVEDSDAVNETTTILHQVSIGDNDYVTALVPVAVTDDDALALTLSSTETTATFPDNVSVGHYYDGRFGDDEDTPFNEGTTATYTVELDSEPDGDITISLSSSDTGALTVSPASITFTKTGDASDPNKYEWDDPQTATITAVSDTDGWDEIEEVYHEATINGEAYTLGQVAAFIKDSALPTLSYRQNNADIEELSVNEGGTTTYTVEMDSEPDADVTVLMLSTDTSAVTISHDSIVFTKTGEAAADGKYEWDDPQTITVTGVADGDQFDDMEYIWHWHNIDGRPFYWWPSVKVTVADGNRAPYFEDGLETTREVPEDAIQGDNVGDPITATDLNAGDTLTYTLEDPSGLFAINGATGQITVAITDPPVAQPFDYETGDRDYSMEVSVTETGVNGLSDKIEVKVLVVNVNEKPTVTGDTVLTFAENTATTRVLDRYTATDPENDTISWSVEGTDANAFTIDSSGNLRFSGEQDFETKDELSITIVGTDDGEPPLKDELPVAVTLTDVDEPPEISGSESLTFAEGTSDTTVLATYGAHDPEEVTTSFTWSLSGTDSGDFDLSASGELSFKVAPNFEGPADSGRNNEYNVNIRANDGSLTGSLAVTVTVTDVNEAPTISGDETLSYAENTAVTRVLDRYTASDPERSSLTWSVGGTDAGAFNIDASGNLTFAEIPDYEAPADSGGDNVYNVQVVATDDGNLGDGTSSQQGAQSASFDVAVTVTPVNEPPTVSGQVSHSVNENVADFSHTYTASDPEGAASTFTWSLAGTDGGDFNIDRNTGELTFRNTPNFESPADGNSNNEYLVTVRATDEGNLRGDLAVTVTVNDVNEAPAISGDSVLSYAENTATTRALDRYTASDPERQQITWALGGEDADDFRIDTSGNLYFAVAPDHENPDDTGENNVYKVQVMATDDGNLGDGTTSLQGAQSASFDVTVTVTPVDEPPEISGDTAATVNENADDFSRTYSASDPEGVNSTFTWSLSGTDGGDFNIDRNTGKLTFRNTPNYESPADSNRNNEYLVTVQANDGQKTGRLEVAITVGDVNEAPEFSSSSLSSTTFSFPENRTTSIYSYRATDPEGETISWSVSGTDRGDFEISSSGVLSFAETPDFELPDDADGDNEYLVTVVVQDPTSNQATLNVTVNVTNAPGTEEPTITTTSRTSFAFQENGTGTVYTFRARDPQGLPISWSLRGTDAGQFNISSGGVLTFLNSLDFENPADANGDNVYEVTIVATDVDNLTDGFSITVTVTNHAEGVEPTISTRRPPATYRENDTRTVYTFRASDPQRQAITWLLSGTDAGDFDLDASSGALTFQNTPDYEAPADNDSQNDYDLVVEARDTDGNVDRLAFTVTVTDVNEGPEISPVRNAPSSVPENYGISTLLASFTATDPEDTTANITRWSTSGTDGGDFVMNPDGELRFRNTPDYERPADSNRDNIYTFSVRASDGQYYGYYEVTVEVTPVNEPPAITTTSTSATALRQPENRTSRLYTYRATDQEGSSTVTWSVGGTDARFFAINERGEFSFDENNPPNFEQPADSGSDNVYDVTIQATDDDSNRASLDVTVSVTEVNEGPEISPVRSAPSSVPENYSISTLLASFTATDPEDTTADITRWSTSGTDGGDFVMNPDGDLRFRNTPDYERPADSNRDNIYTFSVRASDGRYFGYYEVTVEVTPVNEPPTITTTSSSATAMRHPENRTSRLYTYRATDPEGSSTVTWSVGGTDARFFAINERGEFSFDENNAPDFEQPADSGSDNVYDVTIQVSDDSNPPNTASLPVTVTVTDVNEGPEVTSGGDSFTVQENRNWAGASFTAADPEDGDVTRWALGGRDGGDFTITNDGLMTFRRSPDFERPDDSDRDNVYEVDVRPYDGRYYGSHPVTVTVGDVAEITGAATLSRAEAVEGILATYTATGRGDLTVDPAWRLTGTDGGDFLINEDGELTFRNTPDYERPADSNRDNEYVFNVQVSDDRYYGLLEVMVTVTAVNEPPTITTTSRTEFTQQENRITRLYTWRATDPEGGSTITWSLGGPDSRFFAITERGEFSFDENSPPDFEARADSDSDNIYQVTIQVNDDSSPPNTASLPVTVTVTDVNEGPQVSGPTTFTIGENSNLSNAVYTATDPEGLNVARWNLGGRDGSDFFITQGGTLYFRNLPDFERPAGSGSHRNEYLVEVRPSDGRNTGSLLVTVTVTDVDEPPEFNRGSRTAFTQRENLVQNLYTYRATDPEGGDVTWSVAGEDGSHFTIDAQSGVLSFTNEPDFDSPGDTGGDNVYNIAVQARDPQSNVDGLAVTVTVTEVNEGPVITRQGNAPGSVPENTETTRVLATYTATDPERPTVKITQWSTTGRDGGDFVMNALGQLMFRNVPDYERPADSDRDNVYEVTIRASDGRYTGSLEEVQTVTVTPVDEPPVITTTSRIKFTQQENRTSTLYTFRATDPEGETVTWSAEGADGSHFAFDEQGRFSFDENSPPDFDLPGDSGRDNVYDVTIQARDPQSNTSRLEVTVTVTNHNEGEEPTMSTRRPPTTYRENETRTVYTFSASDPQRQEITWTLEGDDAGDFTLTKDDSGRGVLTFNSPPDFEDPVDDNRDNVYELTVVATDEDGNSDRVSFTITVTNHNEGVEPTISTRRPPATYRENDTRTVYTFSASDPQRDTITWSREGTDAGDFTITTDSSGRGVLNFSSPPDFENPVDANRDNVYELTVVAADGTGNSDGVSFTITVTDLNEGPTISLEGSATTTVPENTADTVVLADYTATDPENTGVGIYRWSTTGRDGGDFVVSDLGELRFRYPPDYERPADSDRDNVYEVIVRAYDGRAYGMLEEPLLVTVTEVNEAPVITTKSRTQFTQRENTPSILYTFRATDQDQGERDSIQWSVEGEDGGDFAIYNGVLGFRLLPDFEQPVDEDEDNVYHITVVATDSRGLRDTVDAVVTVTEQPEGPVIAGRTSYTFVENYDIAQALGTYTATDAKDGRSVYPRWSLSGRDGGDFVIDQVTGILTFRNIPDYDRPADSNRDNLYEVTVRGYDGRYYGNLDITVEVTGINEHDPVVTGRETLSFREGTTTDIRLYTYRAMDDDLNTVFTWTVEGDDGNDFAIAEGILTFSSPPDFERPGDSNADNVYEITVVASDGDNRGTLDVAITVTEQNEGPEVAGTAAFTVSENQDLPGAAFTATDPEATIGVTATITWSTSGRDGGDFLIDRQTGVLTFRNLPDFERPADANRDNVYEVTVRAFDGRVYGSFDVTVTVNDVSEISGPTSLTRDENLEGTLATYSSTGQGALTVEPQWRLTGTDSGDFIIDRDSGVLTFRNIPDHERPADSNRDNVYEFTVQVSDGTFYATHDVTVTVNPVNEPPGITGRDALSFRENTPTTTTLYTYSAVDQEGEDFTWGLGGLDASDFTITTDSRVRGVLTFSSPPNFDSPGGSGTDGNQYLVTIQARDSQGNTGEFPVVVTVTDQNEGAVVSGQQSITVQENTNLSNVVYTASDPEGQSITRWSLSGSDGGDFLISEDGELTFRNTPDFDRPADSNRDNEYLVTVRAYDGRTYGNLDVVVTVTNINEHDPVIRSGSRTEHTYREEGTSAIYTYSAADQDKDDEISWTVGGIDDNRFEFNDRNGLMFREPPDYESPGDVGGDNEYNVTVIATDSGGRSASLAVTVTVTELDEGPKITGTAAYTVVEGGSLTGATFTGRDPEDPTAEVTSWRLAGSDAGDFTITSTGANSSQLTFRNVPDYDRPADSNRDNEYLVTVRAYNGGTYGSLDVTVTVTDTNESDPVVSGTVSLSFRENTATDTRLSTYTARDMDLGTEIAWSVRGTDGGDFTITPDSSGRGQLFFSSAPNHEIPADADQDNVYDITVVASDGSNEGTLNATVTVTAVNEGPEVSGLDSRTVDENFDQVLATYTATDPEGSGVSRWTLVGADSGDFTITDTGQEGGPFSADLKFRNPPDHDRPDDGNRDNVYLVTIRPYDGSVYGSYDVTITVTADNEGPVITGRDSLSFGENTPVTTRLYTYRATDPEGDDFAWTVEGTDGSRFGISESGVLTFSASPDYESPPRIGDNDYQVTIVATDANSNRGTFDVVVTVTDVNEGPVVAETGSNTAITVPENHTAVLSTYSATDPEGSDITRWSVTGTDGGDFTINEDGELSFRNPPDDERRADSNRDNIYLATVRAYDGRNYGSLEVTVTVTPVDEAPEFRSNSTDTFAYQENGTADLYTYRATDPEGEDVSWSLRGDDAGAFTISEAGVLAFADPPDYEAPGDDGEDNVYNVTVVAADEQGNERELAVIVTVTNLTD